MERNGELGRGKLLNGTLQCEMMPKRSVAKLLSELFREYNGTKLT